MRLVILAAALLVSVPVFAATAPPKPMTMAQALANRSAKQAAEKKIADAKAAVAQKKLLASLPHAPLNMKDAKTPYTVKLTRTALEWQWAMHKLSEPECEVQDAIIKFQDDVGAQMIDQNDKRLHWKPAAPAGK